VSAPIPADVLALLRACPYVTEVFVEVSGVWQWTADGAHAAEWVVTVGDGDFCGEARSPSLRAATLSALDGFAEATDRSARYAHGDGYAERAAAYVVAGEQVRALRVRIAETWREVAP